MGTGSQTERPVAPDSGRLLAASRGDGGRGAGAEPDGRLREDLAVADPERADPALAAGDVADERSQLDELGLAEVRVQLLPQRVVGERGVPADGVRVPERNAFALAEERGR